MNYAKKMGSMSKYKKEETEIDFKNVDIKRSPANQGNHETSPLRTTTNTETESSLLQLEFSIVLTALVVFLMTCCYFLLKDHP
jgi:hypothetical protein